ncbi:tRNA lysidine(34) synthetase TilS [Undibacterium seohonense]|uniref:tRNA(Ile)-lysidine synthase n=1 Tax=Undibacterium seohonense TaxID=1344950 RepID=A0ABR6X6V9_9BURK|nr:tRNA lysidine(34) synthetase TilS [Undibacterium seohonense]MBC3808699.1 tRNA lysidine(34) synthetase TilS [Undibacterium seohonense]
MSDLLCHSVKELEQSFFAKLSSIIQSQALNCRQSGIAIAYSGGLDSTVLLVLSTLFAKREQVPLFAYHVNHGLSPNAARWLEHCRAICDSLKIPFRAEQVVLENQGQGIEAVARSERYLALGRMCQRDQVNFLLTGHHLDDQAETMLMQLFRGTGLRGLAGMDEYNFAPDLLGSPHILLARPLLFESKNTIQSYANANKLSNVDDESNFDICFTRNAVRHLLMPKIEEFYPGFSERLLRTSSHVRAAQGLLDEVAISDLRECEQDNTLNLGFLRELTQDRFTNVFRHWLTINRVQLPSTSKITEIQFQLLNARNDARVAIRHGNFSICRHDHKIYLEEHPDVSLHHGEISFTWNGEHMKYFPELRGTLIFQESAVGIDEDLLKQSVMTVRQRQQGARLRLAKNRPSRDLKSHFQSQRIPFWQREKLPYIYIEEQLFFVGLLGIDAAFLSENMINSDMNRVKLQLIWEPDHCANKVNLKDGF